MTMIPVVGWGKYFPEASTIPLARRSKHLPLATQSDTRNERACCHEQYTSEERSPMVRDLSVSLS